MKYILYRSLGDLDKDIKKHELVAVEIGGSIDEVTNALIKDVAEDLAEKHCDQFLHFCFSFFVFYFLWLHMLAPNKIRVNLFRGEFRKSVQISHCFQRVHDLPRFSCPVDD